MISIIVSIYNTEKYLPKCLDSLIGQTYRDIEIICVDDGSTDGSAKILERYSLQDSRIKLWKQNNTGLSGARNAGIELAHGGWIMFVDSDDWLSVDCCEKVISVLEDNDLVFFSYIREFQYTSSPKYIMGKEARIFDVSSINLLNERLIAPSGKELMAPDKLDSLSTAWGKIYRSDIIKRHHVRFVDEREIGTEDLLFNVGYFKHIKSACYLPDCLYHYRKTNGNSLAYSYKPNLDEKWLRLFGMIENEISSYPILKTALQRRKALCLFGLGLNITFSKAGWNKECRMLSNILHSEWYTSAIKKLPLSAIPLHWRFFYTMAKWKQTWSVLLMLKVMNRIINR